MTDFVTGDSATLYDPRTGRPVGMLDALGREQINQAPMVSLDEIAAATPYGGGAVYLQAGLRSGLFKWQAGDFTTQVASDPMRAIYVPSAAQPVTSGCWVREWGGMLLFDGWFGVDPASADNTAAKNAWYSMIRASAAVVYKSGQACKVAGICAQSEVVCLGSVDATRLPGSVILYNGQVLRSKAAGGIALNMRGSGNSRWKDLYVIGDETTPPAFGVVLGRWDNPSYTPPTGRPYKRRPSPWNHFDSPTVIGAFSRASVLNDGSEAMTMVRPSLANAYQSAAAAYHPATATVVLACDAYNKWQGGTSALSPNAPNNTPSGYRNGTLNSINLISPQIRCWANNITPMYLDGVRGFEITNGYCVTGSDVGIIWGDGGYDTAENPENVNVQNKLDLHCESWSSSVEDSEDVPVRYTIGFLCDNGNHEVEDFEFNDLKHHGIVSWATILSGTGRVRFRNADILLNEGRTQASGCTLFDAAYKTRFRGDGKLVVGASAFLRSPMNVTTVAGSSVVSVNLLNTGVVVGQRVYLSNDDDEALSPVNGVTLNGQYVVLSTNGDSSVVTIETGQTATASGTGDAAPGGISVKIVASRLLDLADGVQRWDGEIHCGPYHGLVSLPAGFQTVVGHERIWQKGTTVSLGTSATTGWLSDLIPA